MRVAWLAAFLLASALAACAPDAQSADEPGVHADAVPEPAEHAATTDPALTTARQARAAIEAYVAAVSAMDLDSAGTFYSDAPDFQWIEDGSIRYGSARESRESLAGLGAMASSTELTLSDLTVTALGADAAVATCNFTQEIGIDGGQGFSFSGAMTIVLRSESGRWLFASGHTSSVRARPDGGADAAPGERP